MLMKEKNSLSTTKQTNGKQATENRYAIGKPWQKTGWIEPNYSTRKTNQTKNKRPKSRTTCGPLKTKIMDNPSKIIEGGVEYSLGKFDGKSVMYDFPKILIYLNAKGKLLFGKNFKIYDEDKSILLKLCSYFIKDKENCETYGIDIEKGILLSGPVGCGKTSLMKLLRHIVPMQRPYEMIPCRNVTFSFNHLGFKTVEEYGNTKFYCFDDLGVEPAGRFYGKDLNVMGEVLLSRYELYLDTKHKIKTHATTNLNAEELEERYGNRVRSRMRELFNLIAFETKARDKRK